MKYTNSALCAKFVMFFAVVHDSYW